MTSRERPTWVFTPTRRRFSAGAVASVREDLDRLEGLVAGIESPVYLVGGLGLAARHDRLYRNHRDLDVAIFREDLPHLTDVLARNGHAVGRQRVSAYLSPWHRVQTVRPLSADDLAYVDPERTHLRAYERHGSRWRRTARRSSYIDVFLLGWQADGVVLHGYDTVVPWSSWGPARALRPGSPILLPNVAYRGHLPSRGRKQRADLTRLGVDAAAPREVPAR